MKYIDIHSHLNFPDYGDEREAVIKRMQDADTQTICVGVDLKSSQESVELAEKYDGIYACIGIHPADNPNEIFNEVEFEKLVSHPKVAAIGECGMDFYHQDKTQDYERQKDLFLKQVEFALKHDKPLMIHSRGGEADVLELLKPLKAEHGDKLRGDVHFYAGSLETAKGFWEIGFSTSFTGVITFARDYDEIIKSAPLERLMSETDAPFVAPAPYRGKRNEPSYVSEVVKKIAEIRGEDLAVVEKAMVENASKMFGISL